MGKNKKLVSIAALALFFSGVSLVVDAEPRREIEVFDCGESAVMTLSGSCRPITLQNLDELVLSPLHAILKFNASSYEEDPIYKRLIDRSYVNIRSLTAPNYEVEDRYDVFFALLGESIEGVDINALLEIFAKFPSVHTGCHFTREQIGSSRVSRSFVIAYDLAGLQKFAVIHIQIGEPQRVHAQLPSERRPEILAIEVFPLVPGFKNSNAVLRVHIVPDPTERCLRIIDLIDPLIIEQL